MNPLPPPAGGDVNRAASLLATWWTELSISIIMVIMRLCSRCKLKNIGIDDWLIVTALVMLCARFKVFKMLIDSISDFLHFHDNCVNL